ncbi:hypothetical protein OAN61_00210 [bacterium]|nr:hypothetical protein [bacterium]
MVKFKVTVVLMQVLPELAMPITQGYNCTLYTHGDTQECKVKLLALLKRDGSGEVARKNPRVLGANDTAHVAVALSARMPLCTFAECRQLGRFQLRKGDVTVATGMVTKLPTKK